jgi:chromate reductase, NAD(P)H dehydrogenase (quinone)
MPLLLAMSGSLRAVSHNTSLLEAAARVAPEGVVVEQYGGLARLRHFNPDLDVDPPPRAVAELRAHVAAADGLIISSPEYARGIPGSLKNALDWLVSSVAFPNKPVALFNASQRSVDAQAALRLVLSTMSARVIDEASITVPLLGTDLDADGIAGHPAMAAQIRGALDALLRELRVQA